MRHKKCLQGTEQFETVLHGNQMRFSHRNNDIIKIKHNVKITIQEVHKVQK